MKRILRVVLSATLLTLSAASTGWGQYQFDDLYGPSGKGAQWMVITGNMDTGGEVTLRSPIDTRGNIVLSRESVYVTNGQGLLPSPNGDGWPIHTLFLVVPGSTGNMKINFDWLPQVPSPGASFTQDVLVDNASYQVIKTPLSTSSASNKLFDLGFVKTVNPTAYGSVRGNFLFHQNPNSLPSQTIQVPFIVANVYNGTAEGNPLLFKATLRESVTGSGAGNIAAYDRFDWKVTEDLTVGDTEWVFVPIPKLPIDSNTVNYRLTTEITNYTGIRYAMQRYDGYAWAPLFPSNWAFDIPKAGDVPSRIELNELSHIPPGLVTTYNQSFNVVSGVKEAMHVYPVDPASGFRNLTLSHRSIFGLDLGTGKDSASPNSYSATGFQLLSAGTNFLSKVGTTMGVANVKMPEPADGVMGGAVSYAYIAGDVIASLGIDTGVPGRMTGSAGTGLLPLYLTFNMPRSNQLVAPKWDAFLKEWRDTGNVQSLFASTFSLYLQDGFGNNLDLVEWLRGQSAYAKTVKVFVDEQRSVLTVSFIAILMDGASATVRLVDDATTSTNNSHIVVMDGNANNRWDMKFFVAPAGYVPTDRKPPSDGGSSGCNGLTLGIVLLLACVPARIKWR